MVKVIALAVVILFTVLCKSDDLSLVFGTSRLRRFGYLMAHYSRPATSNATSDGFAFHCIACSAHCDRYVAVPLSCLAVTSAQEALGP